MLQLLIDDNLESCFIADKNGYLPLHLYCSKKTANKDTAKSLFIRNHNALHVKTDTGKTPLGLAKNEMVRKFLQAKLEKWLAWAIFRRYFAPRYRARAAPGHEDLDEEEFSMDDEVTAGKSPVRRIAAPKVALTYICFALGRIGRRR